MSVVILGVSSLVAMFVIGYRIMGTRRSTRSASDSNQRADFYARATELFVIAILAAILSLFILSDSIGPTIPVKSFAIIRGSIVGIVMISTVVAALFAIIWKRSISQIAFTLAGSLLAGSFVFASTDPLSYKHFVEEIRQVPMPVEITIDPPLSGVDVIINGILMGQAPLWTTIEEIIEKTPSLSGTKPVHSSGTTMSGMGYYEDRRRVQMPQFTNVLSFSDREIPLELDFEFKRHGEPLLVSGNLSWTSGSRMFGRISPAKIPFRVVRKEWSQDVTTLLSKARVANYHVDHNWIDAAEPYTSFVRPIIVSSLRNEPQFQQVLNDWATRRYRLDQVIDSNTAWQALQSICHEADERRLYRTDSTAGDAVELLLGKLNSKQVVEGSEKRLTALNRNGVPQIGWSWNFQNDEKSFSYDTSNAGQLLASDFVLAHAVWKLDAQWSKSESGHDNLIEQRLSPRLLQLSYFQPVVRGLAEAIGGSMVAEFHRRLQRDVHGFEPSPNPTENEHVEGLPVLRNFWIAVNATDDLGEQFRRDHASKAVEWAKRQVGHWGFQSLPSWMDFLFLDVEGEAPLACVFWKTFDATIDSTPACRGFGLNLKWTYLARVRPLPHVSEFTNAIRTSGPISEDFFNPDISLSSVPPELKFEIATKSLPILRKLQEPHDVNSIQYVVIQRMINQLITLISNIPSAEAVEFILSIFHSSGPEAERLSEALNAQSQSTTMSAILLKSLSQSEDAKLRRIVLTQLEMIPNQENRVVLLRLQNDDDSTVRDVADAVAARIKRQQRLELPEWVD